MTPAEPVRPASGRLVDVACRHPVVVDAVLALLVLAAGAVLVFGGHVPRADRAAATAVSALVAVPVALRRRHPLPAAVAVAVVAGAAQVLVPGASAAILLAVLVTGYSVIAHGPRRIGPLVAGVMVFGSVLPFAGLWDDGRSAAVVGYVAVLGLLVGACTWLAGALRRAQLRSVAELRERARLLEEGRRREVHLELLAERSRISREVHDVVAHSLSGIIAQADGGRYAAASDPQRAVDVLDGIAGTGREALADIRGLLSMLRETTPSDDDDHQDASRPQRAAQPGVDDVAGLVEQVRAGGLPVELAVTGSPRTLPSGVGLTVYRVVQEGLTNVVKHAGVTTATRVGLDWAADELAVAVRDEGPRGGHRSALPRGGHGLVGMRERAALQGGTLEAGPHPEGGFVVRVRLPLPGADRNAGVARARSGGSVTAP